MLELAQLLMSIAGFGVPLGLMLLMAGRVKIRNEMDTLIRVITAFCVTMVCYWILGQGIFRGDSVHGLFGFGWAALSGPDLFNGANDLRLIFLFSVPPILATTAMAERGSFLLGNLLAVIVAVFVVPVVAHWVWFSQEGQKGWLAAQGFVDSGGAVVIFASAAFVAIATSSTIGPRMGRFPAQTDRPNGQSPTYHALGMILIVFGLAMVTAGQAGSLSVMSGSLFKILLGVSFAVMTALILLVVRKKDGASLDLMASALAGAVALSAFAPHASLANAALAGMFAGSVSIGLRRVLQATEIDDPGDLAASFLAGGLVGGLVSPVLLGINNQALINQLSVQLIGMIAISTWSFSVPYFLAQIVQRMANLRVSEADEARGLSRAHFGQQSEADYVVSHLLRGTYIGKSDETSRQTALAGEFNQSVAHLRSETHRAADRIQTSITDAKIKTAMMNRIRFAEDTLQVRCEDILLMLESTQLHDNSHINGAEHQRWLQIALAQVLEPVRRKLTQYARRLPIQVELEELETTILAAIDEIGRGAHHVELLLDFSHAEMQGFYSRDHVCDFAQLLDEQSAFLKSIAEIRQSPIQIDCPVTSGLHVAGDSNAFKRILSLTVESALSRLGSKSGQPVRVELRERGSSNYIELECLDTGRALSRRQIRAILEPQVSGQSLEDLGMTQVLPLMLAARLVEAIGGEFNVTSQSGLGTMISCRFRKLADHKVTSRLDSA